MEASAARRVLDVVLDVVLAGVQDRSAASPSIPKPGAEVSE